MPQMLLRITYFVEYGAFHCWECNAANAGNDTVHNAFRWITGFGAFLPILNKKIYKTKLLKTTLHNHKTTRGALIPVLPVRECSSGPKALGPAKSHHHQSPTHDRHDSLLRIKKSSLNLLILSVLLPSADRHIDCNDLGFIYSKTAIFIGSTGFSTSWSKLDLNKKGENIDMPPPHIIHARSTTKSHFGKGQ